MQVFQCLLIAGENCGEDAIKNAESFVILDDDFQRFIERHSELPCLVEESNKKVGERSYFSNFLIDFQQLWWIKSPNGREADRKPLYGSYQLTETQSM